MIFAIEGINYTGKSTIIDMLKKTFESYGIKTNVLKAKPDLEVLKNHFLVDYDADINKALDKAGTVANAINVFIKFLGEYNRQKALLKKDEIFILDRTYLSLIAYTYGIVFSRSKFKESLSGNCSHEFIENKKFIDAVMVGHILSRRNYIIPGRTFIIQGNTSDVIERSKQNLNRGKARLLYEEPEFLESIEECYKLALDFLAERLSTAEEERVDKKIIVPMGSLEDTIKFILDELVSSNYILAKDGKLELPVSRVEALTKEVEVTEEPQPEVEEEQTETTSEAQEELEEETSTPEEVEQPQVDEEPEEEDCDTQEPTQEVEDVELEANDTDEVLAETTSQEENELQSLEESAPEEPEPETVEAVEAPAEVEVETPKEETALKNVVPENTEVANSYADYYNSGTSFEPSKPQVVEMEEEEEVKPAEQVEAPQERQEEEIQLPVIEEQPQPQEQKPIKTIHDMFR